MRTIPDRVLDLIVEHRPHLAEMVANLRAHPEQAGQIEKALATAYLLGAVRLDGSDTWHLSQVASGGPWGGDWLLSSHAAELLGVSDSRIRQRILADELPAIKRGKTWYVRRDALDAATRGGKKESGMYQQENGLWCRPNGTVIPEQDRVGWYAECQHGSPGLGASYGHAEVYFGYVPTTYPEKLTETIMGPFTEKSDADIEAQRMNALCDAFREDQECR